MLRDLLIYFGDVSSETAKYEALKNKIADSIPNTGASNISATNIINYLLYAGGIAAVVMIIVAGLQMSSSAGNPSAVTKAKNTMTMAIVGLIIMILAYAIVNFVIDKI